MSQVAVMVIGQACSSRGRRRLRPPALIVLRLLWRVPCLWIVRRVPVLVGASILVLLAVRWRTAVTTTRRHHGVQWLR